jgi:hypothetical protein
MRRLLFPLLSSTAVVVAVAVVSAQNGAVTVTVDAAASKHAINPNVYGVAYATTAQLADLNVPVNRYGGNNTSRYNWQLNADNRGQDWYFESIGDSSSTAGQRGDDFVTSTRAGHAEPMITIPIIDYIATLGSNRSKLASYSIAKYGAQTGNDSQWYADAGNGVRASDGANITWNTPADANVANSNLIQRGWIAHLVTRWGLAVNGGVRYYLLDNEPSLYRPIATYPTAPPWTRCAKRIRRARVKNADPNALWFSVRNGAGWGRSSLATTSRQHARLDGLVALPDRSHGQQDYSPWLLQQSKAPPKGGGSSTCYGALLPAGRRVQQRHVGGDAGQRNVHPLALGSGLRRRQLDCVRHPHIPQLRDWVAHITPARRSASPNTTGRREPHQRRDDAGRCAGDLRPRVIGHGRALDDSRHGHADLQSHQDLPELRRPALGVRRHERENDLVVES